MRAHAIAALDLLERRRHTLPDATRPQAEALLARAPLSLARFDEIRALDAAGPADSDSRRLSPRPGAAGPRRISSSSISKASRRRPLAERRAKQSPLKDVAGMMRSFSYAAYAALFAFTVHAPDDVALLEPWAAAWQHWVGDAFLREYRSTVAAAPWAPADEAFSVLLRALMLDKALYELTYELNNRPEWVRIPLAGLLNMSA